MILMMLNIYTNKLDTIRKGLFIIKAVIGRVITNWIELDDKVLNSDYVSIFENRLFFVAGCQC